jgi:hypothetical protein
METAAAQCGCRDQGAVGQQRPSRKEETIFGPACSFHSVRAQRFFAKYKAKRQHMGKLGARGIIPEFYDVPPAAQVGAEGFEHEVPSDLVIELTTPGLQSLSKLFFGGQRQLVFAREDLVPQVA